MIYAAYSSSVIQNLCLVPSQPCFSVENRAWRSFWYFADRFMVLISSHFRKYTPGDWDAENSFHFLLYHICYAIIMKGKNACFITKNNVQVGILCSWTSPITQQVAWSSYNKFLEDLKVLNEPFVSVKNQRDCNDQKNREILTRSLSSIVTHIHLVNGKPWVMICIGICVRKEINRTNQLF